MMLEHIREFLRKYGGRVAGSAAGLAVAILFLTIGFFRTLLVLICVGIGFFVGMFRDSREEFLEFVERILPKGLK
jgi:uncharacterized membrane protein